MSCAEPQQLFPYFSTSVKLQSQTWTATNNINIYAGKLNALLEGLKIKINWPFTTLLSEGLYETIMYPKYAQLLPFC